MQHFNSNDPQRTILSHSNPAWVVERQANNQGENLADSSAIAISSLFFITIVIAAFTLDPIIKNSKSWRKSSFSILLRFRQRLAFRTTSQRKAALEAAFKSTAKSPPINPNISFIEQYLQDTLKGKIRCEFVIDQRLSQHLATHVSQEFEYQLEKQCNLLKQQLKSGTASSRTQRQLNALHLLRIRFEHWQKSHYAQAATAANTQQILNSMGRERIYTLVRMLDRNQPNPLRADAIQGLADSLYPSVANSSVSSDLNLFVSGLNHGLESDNWLAGFRSNNTSSPSKDPYKAISSAVSLSPTAQLSKLDHRTAWIWELSRPMSIFVRTNEPWTTWEQYVGRPLPKALFSRLANNRSVAELVQQQQMDSSSWVELAVLLNLLQERLVWWYDNQPYHPQAGQILAEITFSDFSQKIWRELTKGFQQADHLSICDRKALAQACFLIELQTLLQFVRRSSWFVDSTLMPAWGESYQSAIAHLETCRQRAENIQVNARILTVLGYFHYWCANYTQAMVCHQHAKELHPNDTVRLVADLNGISRLHYNQNEFEAARNAAYQALNLAQQVEDTQGSRNAMHILQRPELRR